MCVLVLFQVLDYHVMGALGLHAESAYIFPPAPMCVKGFNFINVEAVIWAN